MQGRALGSPQSSGTQRTGRRRLSSSDEGEPGQPCNQWPWGPEGPSDSGTSRGVLAHRPAEPAGEPPQHLRRRDLPEERSPAPGETPLQDHWNPSTFGQTNGGALSTRYRPIWPNSEKIHVKAGAAVSERARQNSVSTFSFACEAKPNYDGPRSQDHYQRGAISPQLSAYLQHTRLSRGCLNM